jgi:uncharacterized membrane protein
MPKFCISCGAALKPQARFCGECGEPASPGEPAAQTPASSSGLGLSENGASTLAYALGFITGIIFLVLEPYSRSRTVRFHALHSIFFNVAWVILYVVLIFVSLLIAAVLPFAALGFGALMMIFNVVLWLGGVALWVVLMVKAYQGQRFRLPIIGRLAEKHAEKGEAAAQAPPGEAAAPQTPPPEQAPPGVVQPTAPLGPEPEPPLAPPPVPEPPPAEPPEAPEAAPPESPPPDAPPDAPPPALDAPDTTPPEDADTDKDTKS